MKFSIRDLLWLLTVLGLFFAWEMERQRMDSQVDQIYQTEQKLSAKEAELTRVTHRLRREESRRRFYQSGTIGYPAYGFEELPSSSASP